MAGNITANIAIRYLTINFDVIEKIVLKKPGIEVMQKNNAIISK